MSSGEDIQYFEKQERIYPKYVGGVYRNIKWITMIIGMIIYYGTPFIRWDRGENAPDQAVLIDMQRGRAYWFWFEIWPQETYILTGILIFAAICLFFVSSLFGRVWCGYLCFQTVWTDLFIWVERIVQGDRTKRMRLREGPWTFQKIWKLTLTHIIWLIVAVSTGGAFVLYFNDAPTLINEMLNGQFSFTVLAFVGGLTFMTYLMAGFAREQVCIYMCPYARFQSAMFDKDTMIIGYDVERGEPRGKHKKGSSWENRGHCIDCTACVQVCPMGIDIREGLQMECIACGLCIDACNDIMDKMELPRGLIRYDTERGLEGKSEKKMGIGHFLRPRTFYYIFVLALVGGLMITTLLNRPTVEITMLHDRNPLFVTLSSGEIRNGYELKILNKTHDDKTYSLSVDGIENARLVLQGAGQISADNLFVGADMVGHYRVFVSSDMKPADTQPIIFTLTDNATGVQDTYESIFVTRRSRSR